MEINETKIKKAQEEALEILQKSDDKSQAIVDAIEKINEAEHANLIAEITMQAAMAKSDEEYSKKLGLRTLNKEEKEFYEKLKEIKQAITADQVDIIPTSLVNRTLDDIKKDSGILTLIDFTPADVKKWLVAEKTGTYAWGPLTGKITEELSAEITSLNIELSKLSVALVIPKAISDLALPFVDKYFTAILKETINDGAEYAFLEGTGKDMPIGIYKQINSLNEDGTHKDKKLNIIESFTPKGLAPLKDYLSKDGTRTYDEIALICNPSDEANYVAPALYDAEGKMISSYKDLKVFKSANNKKGKAIFVLPRKYIMGFSGFKLNEYKETKAMDDADLIIAKAYGNGRAVDDYCAYPIDVTKLKEYVPSVKVVETVTTAVQGTVNTKAQAQ